MDRDISKFKKLWELDPFKNEGQIYSMELDEC
jgi:hypothetical protein